jgi:AcrR family transcriptional regulator
LKTRIFSVKKMKKKPELNLRKTPVQRRSHELHEYILQAATRVLQQFGAGGFTTNKVAEAAGISIGSFYQYYPNKESLLFNLHHLETQKTWKKMEEILSNAEKSHHERLFEVIEHFFQSESDETELRKSLNATAVFYQKTDEFKLLEMQIFQRVKSFLSEFITDQEDDLNVKTEVFITVTKSLAEEVTNKKLSKDELTKWINICYKIVSDFAETSITKVF